MFWISKPAVHATDTFVKLFWFEVFVNINIEDFSLIEFEFNEIHNLCVSKSTSEKLFSKWLTGSGALFVAPAGAFKDSRENKFAIKFQGPIVEYP